MLTETNSQITQVLCLVDDLFDPHRTIGYRLAIELEAGGISVAVWDDVYNKILALERFSFQKTFNSNTHSGFINDTIKQSSLLNNSYKRVSLAIVNAKSTLVPNALFDTNKKETLLQFNHTLDDGEIIAINNLPILETKNIFSLPKTIEQQFKGLYTNLNIAHYSSPLIENILLNNKHNESTKAIVHIHSERFEVIILNAGKLQFYNTFTFQAAEDFIYYLLFVFEQLKLNPETINVELLGEIDKSSSVYQLLYKYIRNVKFGARPENFDYSFKITSLPKQYYYSLFSQFLYN